MIKLSKSVSLKATDMGKEFRVKVLMTMAKIVLVLLACAGFFLPLHLMSPDNDYTPWVCALLFIAGLYVFFKFYRYSQNREYLSSELSEDDAHVFFKTISEHKNDPQVMAFAHDIFAQGRLPLSLESHRLLDYLNEKQRVHMAERKRENRENLVNIFQYRLADIASGIEGEGNNHA